MPQWFKNLANGKQDQILNWLLLTIELCLCSYLVLAVSLYEPTANLRNNLATVALVCAIASIYLRPPNPSPQWPYILFLASMLAFFGFNLLSVKLAAAIPGLGPAGFRRMHGPEMILLGATGLGLRTPRSAGRVLAVFLAAAGVWYLVEMAGFSWQPDAWMDDRLTLHRELHTILGMELLPVFALYFGCALMLKDRKQVFASCLGAALIGLMIFLNKSRFILLSMGYLTLPAAMVLQDKFGARRQKIAAVLIWCLVVAPALGGVWYHLASPKRKQIATAEYRIISWKYSAKIMEQSPWY